MAERWQEREKLTDQRIAKLCYVIAMSAGSTVKMEDFLPHSEVQQRNVKALQDRMSAIRGVKRVTK